MKYYDAGLESRQTSVGLRRAGLKLGALPGGVHRRNHGEVQSVLPHVPAGNA